MLVFVEGGSITRRKTLADTDDKGEDKQQTQTTHVKTRAKDLKLKNLLD